MLGKIEGYKRRYRNRPDIEQFEIQPLETFDWRWFDPDSYWRGGWIGLVVGPIIGAVFWHYFGPARGVSFGLIVAMFVTLFMVRYKLLRRSAGGYMFRHGTLRQYYLRGRADPLSLLSPLLPILFGTRYVKRLVFSFSPGLQAGTRDPAPLFRALAL